MLLVFLYISSYIKKLSIEVIARYRGKCPVNSDILRACLYFLFNLGKPNVCFCDIILKGESILFLIKEPVTLHITSSVTQYSFSEWASSKRCLSDN